MDGSMEEQNMFFRGCLGNSLNIYGFMFTDCIGPSAQTLFSDSRYEECLSLSQLNCTEITSRNSLPKGS